MTPEIGWVIINTLTIIILIADLYLWKGDRIEGNTWSQIIIQKSKENIYYPFLWGCLMGHWFL